MRRPFNVLLTFHFTPAAVTYFIRLPLQLWYGVSLRVKKSVTEMLPYLKMIIVQNIYRYTGCSLNIVFFKILRYFRDSVLSRCVCTLHAWGARWQDVHQRCSRTGRVLKNPNISRKNKKGNNIK